MTEPKKMVSFRANKHLLSLVERLASEKDLTVSQYLRQIVSEQVTNELGD